MPTARIRCPRGRASDRSNRTSAKLLRPFLTAKGLYLLCGTSLGLLLPFEKEFDGLARDSGAIIDHSTITRL